MSEESTFFQIFDDFFDLERDAGKQHDMENYTLDRMYPLAALAGNPERKLKIVHVAGTKGKGSTSHFIANLLHSAGHSVGLFTSPHLTTVRERFEINGRQVEFSVLIAAAHRLVDKVVDAKLHPSLFELFTVLALRMFADAGVEYCVLETGIGGLVDATNYPKKKTCAVIVPVSFDHTSLLGNTIAEIAAQKAGIITSDAPVIVAPQPYKETLEIVQGQCVSVGAKCVCINEINQELPVKFIGAGQPEFQLENFTVAYNAVLACGIHPIEANFVQPELPARCQVISAEPLVVLDAAHNGDSSRRLVEAVNKLYPNVHFTVVLGIVAGKDVAGIVRELKTLNADFVLTNPLTSKGTALCELMAEAQKQNLNVIGIIHMLEERRQLPECVAYLFTGSFFTCLIGHNLFNSRSF